MKLYQAHDLLALKMRKTMGTTIPLWITLMDADLYGLDCEQSLKLICEDPNESLAFFVPQPSILCGLPTAKLYVSRPSVWMIEIDRNIFSKEEALRYVEHLVELGIIDLQTHRFLVEKVYECALPIYMRPKGTEHMRRRIHKTLRHVSELCG